MSESGMIGINRTLNLNLNHTLILNPCYSASILVFFHSNFEHKKKPEKPEFRQFVGCKMLIFVKNRNFSDKDIL